MLWSRFWFWFWLVAAFAVPPQAHEYIPAVVGQDVILPCKAPNNNNNISVVEWSRPKTNPDYVYLHRDGYLDTNSQHPSYENRVYLQDKEMKDGDVSLILKNVTMKDGGTYECRVFHTNLRKRSVNEPICIITLNVSSSGNKVGGDEVVRDKVGGDKDGGDMVGIRLGVVGLILLVVASVSFLIYRRRNKKESNLPVPPDEAAAELQLITVSESAAEQTVNVNRTN